MTCLEFFIFLFFQVGCIFQYRPNYMKALPLVGGESQGTIYEGLEFFTLLNIEDTIKTSETNIQSKYDIYRNKDSWWSNPRALARKFLIPPDLSKLETYLTLNQKVLDEGGYLEYRILMGMMIKISNSAIYPPFYQSNFNMQILWKGGIYDQAIQLALGLLQQPGLNIKDQVWLLGFLRILREQLPVGQLPPLREHIREGPICWGVLVLFYTQRLDLAHMAEKLWTGNELSVYENRNISEAIARVKLLSKIKGLINIQKSTASNFTKRFLELHDNLLQESCPIIQKKSKSLVLKFLNHATDSNTPEGEVIATCWMIRHLETYNTEIQDVLENFLLRKKGFHVQYSRESFQIDIQKFLHDGSLDLYPYIGNPFSAFTDLSNVMLQDFQKVLYALKVQEHEIDMTKIHDYQVKKMFILQSLYKASPYVNNASKYLDNELVWGAKEQKYIFKSSFSPIIAKPKKDYQCVICMEPFIAKDAIVEFKCPGSHKFHCACIIRMVQALSPWGNLHCPLCRHEIDLPLPYDSLTIWQYSDGLFHKT
ncbi:hypothetical protein DFH28DRAFT_894605 [Melampsora americana]|nr:hypothetical protein DFH28DRAFT_894605 [Melampsora americana]